MSLKNRMGRKSLALFFAAALALAPMSPSAAFAAETTKSAKPQSQQIDLAKQAVSAVLMDAATGTVLFEKNSHQKLPPASVTKVMTMLLIMEAVDAGKLHWQDKVRTSDYAASMGGSQIFLQPGEEMTLEEMLKGIAVASGNDAAVAVAEHIAGSEEGFVQMMNDRAKELGCEDTHFSNVNGLPTEDHYTSAHDIAVMSRELLKHDQITKFTSIYSDYLRKGSEKPFWLVNTNKLVRFYSGMDGLKTGFTAEAKYCLAATAKRNNMRAIAVVMGAPTSPIRNAEISQMMDYAFANYKSEVMYKAGEVVQKVPIDKGDVKQLPLVAADTVGMLMKKGDKKETYLKQITINDVAAPIKKGQVVGQIVISKDGQQLAKVNLTAAQDVSKASMWQLFKRTIESWMTFGE